MVIIDRSKHRGHLGDVAAGHGVASEQCGPEGVDVDRALRLRNGPQQRLARTSATDSAQDRSAHLCESRRRDTRTESREVRNSSSLTCRRSSMNSLTTSMCFQSRTPTDSTIGSWSWVSPSPQDRWSSGSSLLMAASCCSVASSTSSGQRSNSTDRYVELRPNRRAIARPSRRSGEQFGILMRSPGPPVSWRLDSRSSVETKSLGDRHDC